MIGTLTREQIDTTINIMIVYEICVKVAAVNKQ